LTVSDPTDVTNNKTGIFSYPQSWQAHGGSFDCSLQCLAHRPCSSELQLFYRRCEEHDEGQLVQVYGSHHQEVPCFYENNGNCKAHLERSLL